MKFRKVSAMLLVGAMCAMSFAGCQKKTSSSQDPSSQNPSSQDAASEEKITATIKVSTPSEDQSAENGSWIQTVCEEFNKLHPNWDLTFEFVQVGEDKCADEVTKDIDAAADVFMFANDQLQKLIDAGAIAEIGGTNKEQVIASNSELMVSSVSVGDALYGIPYTANTWFMYYNKKTYSEEDIKSLDTMLEKGHVSFPFTTAWYSASFYIGNGCTFFGPDGTDNDAGFDITGDKATDVTKYLIDLCANPNFADKGDPSSLMDGTADCAFGGTWNYNDLKKALGDDLGIAVAPTFTINGEAKQIMSFAGSKALGVNAKTKYPQIAVALAMYIGGEESQKSHYETRSIVPCNLKLLEDEMFKNDELVIAQNAATDGKSVIQPLVSNMSKWWDAAANFTTNIKSGEINADNYVEQTQKFYEELNASSGI